MVFEELRIQWTSDGETHAIRIDSFGRPTIDGDPPPKPAKAGPARRGRPWSDEEEVVIAARLTTIDDAAAIAADLGRSRGAILARAVKLGLIDPSEVTLRYAGQTGS